MIHVDTTSEFIVVFNRCIITPLIALYWLVVRTAMSDESVFSSGGFIACFSRHTSCNRQPHPVCSLKRQESGPQRTAASPCTLCNISWKFESLVNMVFGLRVAFLLLLVTGTVTVKGKMTVGAIVPIWQHFDTHGSGLTFLRWCLKCFEALYNFSRTSCCVYPRTWMAWLSCGLLVG